MSRLIDAIIEKAAVLKKTLVLPEGGDDRVSRAAEIIVKNNIAKVILLGERAAIESAIDTDTPGLEIVDPRTSYRLPKYAELLYEIRKEKGLLMSEAMRLAEDPLYFGALMVKSGEADGMVAGAAHSTGDVLRPALQIIKTAKGIKTVSSCFIMGFEDTPFQSEEVMVFGDCAVVPDPTAEQLADIAIASANSAKCLAGIENPKVALLSFSTKGSAKHPAVDKVTGALEIVKAAVPEIDIDGELQVDAAIEPNVARLKAPGSTVAGKANVFIFPDLQSGNIGYKLVQRFAKAEAIGPVCQGFLKPVNDLSRGCAINDIVAVAAITAVQAGHCCDEGKQ